MSKSDRNTVIISIGAIVLSLVAAYFSIQTSKLAKRNFMENVHPMALSRYCDGGLNATWCLECHSEVERDNACPEVSSEVDESSFITVHAHELSGIQNVTYSMKLINGVDYFRIFVKADVGNNIK